MNTKNKIISMIFTIVNSIIIYFIASNNYVNRMPGVASKHDFIGDFYNLFLGHGCPTLLVAFVTVIVFLGVNKFMIKQPLKLRYYILLFGILAIINMIVYRVGIVVAV